MIAPFAGVALSAGSTVTVFVEMLVILHGSGVPEIVTVIHVPFLSVATLVASNVVSLAAVDTVVPMAACSTPKQCRNGMHCESDPTVPAAVRMFAVATAFA